MADEDKWLSRDKEQHKEIAEVGYIAATVAFFKWLRDKDNDALSDAIKLSRPMKK